MEDTNKWGSIACACFWLSLAIMAVSVCDCAKNIDNAQKEISIARIQAESK